MKRKDGPFVLVNANVVRPPVSPVGLEYTGEALREAGFPVRVVDLAFEPDWKEALRSALSPAEPLATGISVRNTDDCCAATGRSFLPWTKEVVDAVKTMTAAPVVLGGVGFSVMPEAVMLAAGADMGIVGDGEEAAVALARRLSEHNDCDGVPNLLRRDGDSIHANPRRWADLDRLPPPRRHLFDNLAYEKSGAMVGIETKRGCSGGCIFCADPVAKGRKVRMRPPKTVAEELRDLFAQGVSWFHIGDSEFNVPLSHARDVCRAIIEAGLGDRVRWYTYCAPVPFDGELARLMKRAGCAGINFGVDSLCDEQLQRLGRGHSFADVSRLVNILKEENINYIFDLLAGEPGETEATLRTSIDRVKQLDVPLVGIATGLRVYPGTELARRLVMDAGSLAVPFFYFSPEIGKDTTSLVREFAAGDDRFLSLSAPQAEGSYNYAGDDALASLIKAGARGAYWDILSRSRRGGGKPV